MSGEAGRTARARLLAEVEEAARYVAPLWPLPTAVAVNPLWDLRQLGFHDAIAHARRVLPLSGYPSPRLFARAYAEGRVTDADLASALETSTDALGEGASGGASAGAIREVAAAAAAVQRAGVLGGRAGHGLGEPAGDGLGAWGTGSGSETAAERADRVLGTQLAASVDREVAKWAAAYAAGIVASPAGQGFYAAWRAHVVHDPGARRLVGRSARRGLAELGADPHEAIVEALDRLGVAGQDRVPELARHLGRMPGWAGHAKWRSRWALPGHPGPALALVDYLAVRLCYEAVLVSGLADRPPRRGRAQRHAAGEPGGSSGSDSAAGGAAGEWATLAGLVGTGEIARRLAGLDATGAPRVWLAASELHYRDHLLAMLDRVRPDGAEWRGAPARRPAAQAVFCIDTRSERLRRHLEAAGPYETFGAAGFFGLPIRYRSWGASEAVALCPVLVQPSTEVVEEPAEGAEVGAERTLGGMQVLAAVGDGFARARKGSVSQFLLAEAGGFVAGPLSLARTLAPARARRVQQRVRRAVAPPMTPVVATDRPEDGMSDEEQALFAEALLETMGLTEGFAPLVLLCGHGSTTENNPHASALDCGACSGNRGGSSARAAAAMLNRPATRELLAARGIAVPDETVFVAGEHDTATDVVTLLEAQLVPPSHRELAAALCLALERAGAAGAAERSRELPGCRVSERRGLPGERSADWAEMVPEWGLARNAAFVVAPRARTAGVDLEGRCFLHSYDARVDPDGLALETILTAPMVVGHWISAQYYFSTVDPELLSAGDKVAHNVVAGLGVAQGAGGDLRVGLPVQSLFDGERAYHEPLRLLTIVEAPHRLLDEVIARNTVLRELFGGEWVHLVARADPSEDWAIRRPDGRWVRWEDASGRPTVAGAKERAVTPTEEGAVAQGAEGAEGHAEERAVVHAEEGALDG